jgi:hypothetical protein
MNPPQWASKAHAALLRLYPTEFRDAFGDEIQAVFAQAAGEAAGRGAVSLGLLLLRELVDLPGAALGQRLRGMKAERPDSAAAQPERLARHEALAALAVFLIPAGFIVLRAAPPTLVGKVVPPAMMILLVVGLAAGLAKRFPRWSLPYFGLVISAVVFLFLFQWKAQRLALTLASRFVVQPREELGRLLLVTFWEGVVWLSLLALVACSVQLLGLLPRFRSLARRLTQDWTQLSYLLYGGSMLGLVLTLEEYRHAEPVALVAVACLAAGGWSYLRSSRPLHGFVRLVAGATLAMWVAAAGRWLLVPYQDWAGWFIWHPQQAERWFEAQQTLIAWAWMMVVMATPALLQRLSRSSEPSTAL